MEAIVRVQKITAAPTAMEALAAWLKNAVELRMQELVNGMPSYKLEDVQTTPLSAAFEDVFFQSFIHKNGVDFAGKVLLLSSFCRNHSPEVFSAISQHFDPATNAFYVETGAYIEKQTGRLLPTLKTVIFLLSGNNKQLSAIYQETLNESNPLFRGGVVRLTNPSPYVNDLLYNLVSLDKSYYAHFLYGKKIRLDEMENFPAQLLETTKTFEDLVLAADVKKQLTSVMNYARHYRAMHQKTNGQLQGYVAMFYGPPGTGKTMTASVIGKELGMDVYMVNLSRVISKYIGETEKNLEVVFDRLGNRECILFFDEADALFGKRSEVTEANDRYANQEIAYLLQKIDKCNCLVMLATNFRQNLDFAFTRRILSYIKIDWPGNGERELLWQKTLVPPFSYAPENLPEMLAQKYAITGSNIANVVKLACYEALAQDTCQVTAPMLESFIKLEYIKEKRNPNDPGSWPLNQMN